MKLNISFFDIRQHAPILLVLLSAAIAVAAYLQALDYPFVSDDTTYIPENTKLAGLHLTELWRLFVEPYSPHFEFLPLRELSFWFDMTLFGLNPSAYRLHNIILYLLCLPLMYGTTLALWRYFRPLDTASAPWAAAIVTALFALHPALVESVVWVSGRKYVLPNFFSILTLWLAVNAKREYEFSVPHAIATLIAFVAVMFSKSSYIAVAPIVAMLWLFFWFDIPVSKRRLPLLLWPLSIMLLAVFLLLIFIAKNNGYDAVPSYFGVEAVTRTLAVLWGLVWLAFSPEGRHFLYPVFENPWFPYMVALGGATLVAILGGAVMLLRRRSLEGFSLVIFLLLCVPYLQLIPAKPPALIADRYVAFAVWPAMLLLVSLAWRLNHVPRAAVLLVIALIWSFQTIERPRDWSSFEALIETDFRAFPKYSMPAMYKTGIQLSEGKLREAAETANGITIIDARNNMMKLVNAHQALVDSALTKDPRNAIDIFLDFGLDLKRLPEQAQWNTPLNFMWQKNRIYLGNEWRNLGKIFPDDALVRNNLRPALLSIWKDENSTVNFRPALGLQRVP
jgi:hypothetical protein